MNKSTKRNALVSALLAIMLCVSLISGATYALFTDESDVNIAVTSGKVNVVATVSGISFYSPAKIKADGTISDETNAASETAFANGGTATMEDNTLTVSNMVPGDKITFKIVMTNKSNVDVKYRTVLELVEDEGLWDELVVTIDEEECSGNKKFGDWTNWAKTDAETEEIVVTAELPSTVGNETMNASCTFSYTVTAVQSNTDVTTVWD